MRQRNLPSRRVMSEQQFSKVETIEGDLRTEADFLGGSKGDFIE